MPSVWGRIHCQVALGEIECHLTDLTFINMDTLEAFQQFGDRSDRGHLVADVELYDLIAITRTNVFEGACDNV